MFLFDEVYLAGGPKVVLSSVMNSAGRKSGAGMISSLKCRAQRIGENSSETVDFRMSVGRPFSINYWRQSLICDHYERPVLWPVPALSLLPTNLETDGRNRTQSSSNVRSRLVESSFVTV
jgi:hypothetical protein